MADPTDHSELERFVVENDELLDLEAAIGRFNIFDALRVTRAEIRHSNFLAWLLDPAESHGQGELFLRAIVLDMLREAGRRGDDPPVSAVDVDGADWRGVTVLREWHHTDLLIACEHPNLVICIENKMHEHESALKLRRYKDSVNTAFPGRPALFVFLNPEGDEIDDEWLPYSYSSIYTVFSRVKRTAGGSLGGDVGTFLDHYLNLIGSTFMTDPKTVRLCQTIYTNHRRAIDLIIEHAATSRSQALSVIREWASSERSLIVRSGGQYYVQVIPSAWFGTLSDERGLPTPQSPCDLFIEFGWSPGPPQRIAARLVVGVGPDQKVRLQVLKVLGEPPFQLLPQRKKVTEQWTRVGSQTLLTWKEDEPASEDLIKAAREYLTALVGRIATLPASLRPHFRT